MAARPTVLRILLSLLVPALVLALAGLRPAAADTPYSAARARMHYIMFCQGCHEADAGGRPGRVPALSGFLGHFLKVEGGREFIATVPGVISNPLTDAQVAEVMNWVLTEFSAAELPADFERYTGAEIGRLRQHPLENVKAERARLVKQIERQYGIREPDTLAASP